MYLTCHHCGRKSIDKFDERYNYEKEINSMVLIFEAIGKCKCGYVHGILVDMKEMT